MSSLEATVVLHLKGCGLNGFEREYRFHPERKWRFDFAWPEQRVALEVEGGAWTRGRHTRSVGFINDCTKYNAATAAGWRVLRVTTDHVASGAYLEQLEVMLESK